MDKGDEKMVWKRVGTTVLTVSLAVGLLAQPVFADSNKDEDHGEKDVKGKVGFSLKQGGKLTGKKFFFKDEMEAEWAIKSIIKLAGQGIFIGNGQGYFMPNRSITRAEAVVAAVRLMGKEEEAKSKGDVILQFRDARLIDQKYGWAEGYIAVALESGLFDANLDQFQPEKPAAREWVATLLVRALGYEDEALAKMNTSLPFKDAHKISAGAVGYVAVALEKGLVTGFPNGTFQPNKPVTRAEMATLLDRMDWLDEGVISGVQGNVYLVAPDANSFVVKKANGDLVTVNLDEDAYLYLDGHLITNGELKAGYWVTVIYDKDGSVLLVDLRSNGSSDETGGEVDVKGSIDELTLPTATADGVLKLDLGAVNKTFTLTRETVVKTDGLALHLTDLKLNQRAEIKVKDQLVTEIKVYGVVAKQKGIVAQTKAPDSSQSGSIRLSVGQEVYKAYGLAHQFSVFEGGKEKSFTDVKEGDTVEITTFDGLVKRIDLLSHPQIVYKGEIQSMILVGTNGTGSLTLRLENGQNLVLKLDPKAEVRINGAVKGIGDLRIGEEVTLYVEGGVVVKIVG